MPVLICLLRGINVGGHAIIKMDALRNLFVSLKFEKPQTYVQSGNVVFKTKQGNLGQIAATIQKAIEKKFACRTEVILRTAAELRTVVAKNPFSNRNEIEPNKLHVFFLASDPAKDTAKALRELHISPEEHYLDKRELYIYFPNGMGQSKFPWPRVDKALQTRGTGRNWNSVTKILEIAETLEEAK